MKTAKRFLSMLLALCCVLGMFPGMAFAANDSPSFTDVNATDWFADAVQYVYEKGMMNGTSANTFAPNSATTRSMIVTILHRMENTPSASGETFSDVPTGQWYTDAVAWASANAIVNGYGNGKFGPNDPITREQMTTILYRYSQSKQYDMSTSGNISDFADADEVSTYATEAMNWATGANLISGVGNRTLAPKGNATRAQIATILMRYCENIAIKPTVVETTYTVTFDKNDNSASREEKTVKAGETVSKPADPSRTGYTFDGWYTDKTGGSKFDFTQAITADLTLYAHWSTQRSSGGGGGSSGGSGSDSTSTMYTISFEVNGGSIVAAQKIKANSTATKPTDPTKDGYTFGGWYTDSTCTNAFNFSTAITADITLYAKWNPETSIENGVTVTFYLNDGSEEIYETQTVEMNTPVKEPTAPIRDMYLFTGWYTEPETAAEYNFDTPVTENINLYANWGNPDSTNDGLYAASAGFGTDPAITGIERLENSVSVTINTPAPNVVKVEFLNEDSFWSATEDTKKDLPALQSVETQTPDYCEMEAVSIALTSAVSDALPEHYVMRATLCSQDGKALCDPFYSIQNTAKYEEFDAKTVEDRTEEYPDNIIVVFDNTDPNNNYGVFAQDVKEITTSDTVNTLSVRYTDIDGELIPLTTYCFDNPDQTVNKLRVGEKIFAIDEDGYPRLFQIDSINTNGGTVEITPDNDVALTDFYSVLKADMDSTQENVSANAIVPNNGAKQRARIDLIPPDKKISVNLDETVTWSPKNAKWLTVTGSLKGGVDLDIKLFFDAKWGEMPYFEASVCADANITAKIDIDAEADNKKAVTDEWKAAKISVPTTVPGLELFLQATIPVELSMEGHAGVMASATLKSGIIYNSVSGWNKIQKASLEKDASFSAEATAKIGPRMAIGVQLTGGGLQADIGAQAGIIATASTASREATTEADERHECDLCLKGDLKWFQNATVTLSFDVLGFKDSKPFPIQEKEQTIGKCYWSILHNDNGAVFANKDGTPKTVPVFGWGDCPNKTWRTAFKAQDNTSNELNISLHVARTDNKVEKDGSTPFTEYLYNGKYTAKGTIDDTEVNKSFTVKNAAQEVTVTPTASDTPDKPDNPDNPVIPPDEGEIVASGECGDNLTWTLYEDGTLIISGTGEMENDYDYDSKNNIPDKPAPWYEYRRDIKTIVIENGATSIGWSAFQYCDNLTSIEIPDSVNSISDEAFRNCTSLASIEIPDGVTKIGWGTFMECQSLASVKLPNSITTIEAQAFYKCTSLTSIKLPDSVTEIGDGAFNTCKSLTSINIPDGVLEIGRSTFYDCYSLTSIEIPDSVTSIGVYAFWYCKSLENIKLSKNITKIDQFTFNHCTSLSSIEIPDGVTGISQFAFETCSNLTSITIPASVVAIGYSAFHQCTNLQTVNYGGSPVEWELIEISTDNDCLKNAYKNI